MPFPYDPAIGLYHVGIRLAAAFDPKARAWVVGRKGLWKRLEAKRGALHGCLWMHCASVGEFEQGRPVLEAIKAEQPDLPVLLTFFSPSGYEAMRDFPLATHVEYLPPDSAPNATRLVQLVRPRAVVFVKYEFWYHHLHAIKAAGVPLFLISALFRPEQPFFRWYGKAWRKMLDTYTHIFTQNEDSLRLLNSAGVGHASVAGDTRFDRVAAIVHNSEELPLAAAITGGAPVLVCGSTWPADDALITKAIGRTGEPLRVIVAPHEMNVDQMREIVATYPTPVKSWAETEGKKSGHDPIEAATLLVDRMGVLSRLYRYADVAYVGGGFGEGIHSVLEAAAWGTPVLFGPRHRKFTEARGLIEAGAAWEVRSAEEMMVLLRALLGDRTRLADASAAAAKYVRERTGATVRIMAALRSHL